MENILFIIEGGIGHHFVCTTTIKKLKEKHKCNMIVACGFPAVFEKNPDVDQIIHLGGHPVTMENLYKQIHGNFKCFNPLIYKDFFHFNNIEGLHIKQTVGKLCGIDVDRSDQLYYYPTDSEVDHVTNWKKKKTGDKKKLGIVQMSGSGIGGNPTSQLKELPVQTMSEVIDKTNDRIFWVQIRLKHEQKLPGVGFDAVDYDHRKIFSLMSVADLGLGTDSFSQHVVAGVYQKPYVMVLGRSRKENYAHTSCLVVSNPKSCEYFGCEFPFMNVIRICRELKCMNSITSKQILTQIYKVI